MVYFLPNKMRSGRRDYPGVLTKMNLAIIAKPLGWVTVTWIHVRKRDGEVDMVEIKVVKTPVLELFLCQRLNLYLKTPFSRCNPGSRESLT